MAPRYTWRDLHPGLTLSILGRPVLLKDCDAFTRAFLRAHLGLEESELAPIDTTTPSPEPVQNPLPPYTGFGTEEDSEQSCRRLVLRAPAKDLTKLLSLHNLTLGFLAVPSESDPIPRRKFVVTYHLSDDTIAITEPALKTLGSKRLDRTKVPRPGRSVGDAADPATRYYTWPELKIGSEFVAFGFGYRIVDCDGFAIDWFAKHGLLDLESVRVRAKQVFSRLDKEGKKVFERELRSLDTDKDWTCERGKFLEAVGRALAMEGMVGVIPRRFDSLRS